MEVDDAVAETKALAEAKLLKIDFTTECLQFCLLWLQKLRTAQKSSEIFSHIMFGKLVYSNLLLIEKPSLITTERAAEQLAFLLHICL